MTKVLEMQVEKILNTFQSMSLRLSQLDEKAKNELVESARNSNPWFTEDSINYALQGIVKMLSQDLHGWVSKYKTRSSHPLNIGTVFAGNIPAVGFHDLLCILASGNSLMAKLSEKDTPLMRFLINLLLDIMPELSQRIKIADKLTDIDAVIATGSDNTSRYFEYYFRKYPHIIRKNRTSIGILEGDETELDYEDLGRDIFTYFGLGCRNVSKIYVPAGFELSELLAAYEHYDHLITHHKYRNNYDYNKSIYLVNKEPHLDNGVMLLKQDTGLVSPISVLFYDYYTDSEDLRKQLDMNQNKIQCIVSQDGYWPHSIPFGQAQSPGLTDYADGVDTMKFLTTL